MSRNSMRVFALKQKGQGMMEYVIIVAMIAVAAIGVYSQFGETIRNQTAGLAQEVAGVASEDTIADAQTTAGVAQTRATAQKGMGNYDDDNNAASGE